MLIDFEKWHGCRNDFLLIKLTLDDTIIHSLQQAAPRVCARDGSGVGADGIIAIAYRRTNEGVDPDAVYIINSDGSLAANCGNGLRCVAMSLFIQSGQQRRHFEFKVFDDLRSETPHKVAAEILAPAEGRKPLVALAMGVPKVNEGWQHYDQAKDALATVADDQQLPWLSNEWGAGEIGNPHIVVYTDAENLPAWEKVGESLQTQFKVAGEASGINAHVVAERPATEQEKQEGHRFLGKGIDMTYEMRIYERGAGVTAACGSGACMVAAIALSRDLDDRSSWLRVVMPGGAVYLQQTSAHDPVRMAGPADVVFRGVFDL